MLQRLAKGEVTKPVRQLGTSSGRPTFNTFKSLLGRLTSILGASMPSMSSPEPGQCSTSLIPGSAGWMLVKAAPVLASHTRTTCLSALTTLRPAPPAQSHVSNVRVGVRCAPANTSSLTYEDNRS